MNQSSKKIIVNGLTIIRLISIPLIFIIDDTVARFLLINFLFVTDYLDGYLARRWEVSTVTGAVLDLMADKILVLIILFAAWVNGFVLTIILLLIAFREISSMVIRFKKMLEGEKLVSASLIGKSKTATQFLTIDLMLLGNPIYKIFWWIVVALGYYSYFVYFFKKGDENK